MERGGEESRCRSEFCPKHSLAVDFFFLHCDPQHCLPVCLPKQLTASLAFLTAFIQLYVLSLFPCLAWHTPELSEDASVHISFLLLLFSVWKCRHVQDILSQYSLLLVHLRERRKPLNLNHTSMCVYMSELL